MVILISARSDFRDHHPGPAQWHAVVSRAHSGLSGLADRGVRAQPERFGQQPGRAGTRRPHAEDSAAQRSAVHATAKLLHAEKRRDAIMNTQSALSPAGAAAQYFDVLWWRTFWLLGAVYVIVLIFALWPAWRRRARVNHSETLLPGAQCERRLTIAV